MAIKNIQMNMLNSNSSYDTLWPENNSLIYETGIRTGDGQEEFNITTSRIKRITVFMYNLKNYSTNIPLKTYSNVEDEYLPEYMGNFISFFCGQVNNSQNFGRMYNGSKRLLNISLTLYDFRINISKDYLTNTEEFIGYLNTSNSQYKYEIWGFID